MSGLRRSWLLVPVSDEQAVREAARVDPDVVVLDLAELVPERDKDAARDRLAEVAQTLARGRTELFVQVDHASLEADVAAAARAPIDGVVLANAERPEDVVWCDELLARTAGRAEIVLALETAAANWAAYELSVASPRVTHLTLGRADLKLDLRPEPSGEIHLLPYLMQRLVVVARASGRQALGAWWRSPDRGLLADPARTFRAARRGRRIGFSGALCLTAAQVPALNRAFGEAA